MTPTKEQEKNLQEQYDVFIAGREFEAKAFSSGAKGFPYEVWKGMVLRMQVEVKPGGKAIVRDPLKDFHLEMQWVYDKEQRVLVPWSVSLVGDGGPVELGKVKDFGYFVSAYYAALRLATPAEALGARAPRRRPKEGAPLDVDFYRRLMTAYDQLILEGHPRPAAELAERMGENHSTVRSWLRRGRKLAVREKA